MTKARDIVMHNNANKAYFYLTFIDSFQVLFYSKYFTQKVNTKIQQILKFLLFSFY